jgi:hypothetical protein
VEQQHRFVHHRRLPCSLVLSFLLITIRASTLRSMAAPDRYLITFAYIPDEASWCVCTNFAAVARKVKDLWDVDDCALVFYLTSPAGKATAVKMTTEEDFELWYRGGSPVTQKLIVHDRQRALKVTHSSGFVQMSHRPMLDSLTLRDLGASFYVRHSGLDEVFLVSENEPTGVGSRSSEGAASLERAPSAVPLR